MFGCSRGNTAPQVVGHDLPRHPADEFQRPDMGATPRGGGQLPSGSVADFRRNPHRDWRRVATRYGRCADIFLSARALAAVIQFSW